MYDIAKHLNWPERREGEFEGKSVARVAHFSFYPSHVPFSVFVTYGNAWSDHAPRVFFPRTTERVT